MGFLSVLGMAHKLVEQRVSRGDAVVDATCGGGVDTQFLAGLVGPRGVVYAFDIQEEALQRTRARLEGAAGPAADPDRGGSAVPKSMKGRPVGDGAAAGTADRSGGDGESWAAAGTAAREGRDGASPSGSATQERPRRDAAAAEERRRPAGAAREGRDGAQRPWRLLHASHAAMAQHIPAGDHGRLAAVMFNLGYLPGADRTVITQPQSTLEALEAALPLLRPGGVVTAVLYPGHEGGGEEAEAVLQWAAALPQASGQALLYRMVQKAEAPFLLAVEKK